MDEELEVFLPHGISFKDVEDFNDEHMFFHDDEDEDDYEEDNT